MTFLVPTAFALAVIAIPITVLYILKLRMRQVHVSSDLFWQQIFTARPPRSFWSRFRHPLSWLAQLLILLAIVHLALFHGRLRAAGANLGAASTMAVVLPSALIWLAIVFCGRWIAYY